ncbi:MAG: NAD(P)-dependent oxidoreductase [Chloroflexota bacterium]|nr:NAD(P)-dependent oxidoreductase [Chloroflexota bacterium]
MEHKRGDELLIGGVGGWGIITMGDMLAKAALQEYDHVAWFPCYATMMRGGESECCVIFSDETIPSPVIYRSSTAMVLGAWRVTAFTDRVRTGGLMIVESTGTENLKISRDDIDVKFVPAVETALKLGDVRNANLVMLGAYVGLRKPLPLDLIQEEIEKRFGKRDSANAKVQAGRQAFMAGVNLVSEASNEEVKPMTRKVSHVFYMPGFTTREDILSAMDVEVSKTFCQGEDQIIEAAADADAVITVPIRLLQPFPRRVIENLNKCQIIACVGIGYDSVDLAAATERGICVTNVPDYCLEEVSDYAMTLLLACAKKLYQVMPAVKAGTWYFTLESRKSLEPMPRLQGQTLGLVGFGNIARTLVPKAKAFGLRVIVHDPYVPAPWFRIHRVESVTLEQLLAESDYVSLHSALTPQNEKMLGMEQLKKMKPTACLINTARGGLVDEEALYTALKDKVIAAAGLDVLEPEPPMPDNPILKLDNVIVTGHAAQYSTQGEEEIWARPWEEVARMLRGEWPQGLVNPRVKDTFVTRWGFEPKTV